MKTTFRNRPVEITDVDCYGSVEDAFVIAAYYTDTGADLNNTELEALTGERWELVEEWHRDVMIGRAEAAAEGDR